MSFPGIRNVSLATLYAADGQNGPLAMSAIGELLIATNAGVTSFAKLEDAASANGEVIAGMGMVRADLNGNVTSATGDWQTLQGDAAGALYVTPGTQAATWTSATYAFGSITASYTTALTNSARLKYLRFWNQTDAGVIISFNASTDHLFLAAGAVETIDLGMNGRDMQSNVSVKRLSGAPTTGNLYISAFN